MAPSSSTSSFDDFQRLRDALVDSRGPNITVLAEELELRTDELKKLLEFPPKNDASRAEVKSGKLEINGVEYKINEQFIQEAIQLSDDFNMDEIEAARLLFRGSEEMQKLDRSASQSAVFLYHSRRLNLLECLRLILSYAFNEYTDPDIRELAKEMVDVLSPPRAPGQTFAEKCILAMGSVRQSVEQLRAKEKHNQTLGLESAPNIKEELEMHIRLLMNQHEALASTVYYFVKLKRVTVSDFKTLSNAFKTFEKHDTFAFHHTLPLYAFLTMLCETDSPLSFEEIIQLHKEMLNDYKSSPWPLRYVQASVHIWWLSEFNGLCNDPPTTNAPSLSKLDYVTDIFDPAKDALDQGAFEFLLAVCADVSAEWPLNSAKEDVHRFLQARVPPVDYRGHISMSFRSLMINQLEIFVESFISNMADVLKDIKTREEEDVLLGRKTLGHELERFFLMIHYAYLGRRDAGMVFWSDPESNLHGFISWASMRQTPFMAATFSYMLTSLSLGKSAAEHTHSFLLDEVSPGSTKRRSIYLSWDHVFKQFKLYLAQLEKRSQQVVPANAFRPPPPPAEAIEPAPELSMMLDGFMRLISQVVQESPDVKNWYLHHGSFRIIPTLFQLLGLQASIQLWDSIFSTITAFLADKTEVIKNDIWKALDDWALGAAPPSNTLQLGSIPGKVFAQAGSEKLDAIVASVHPAEAFVRLLASLVSPTLDDQLKDALPFPENLGSMNRLSGIDPYVDFILGTIFSNTTVQNLPPNLILPVEKQDDPNEKLTRAQYRSFRPALQSSCLTFIHTCLATFNEDLLNIAGSNIAIDAAMKSSSLETYAKLHPFARVMEHLLTERCFNVFYEILKLGVEDLAVTDAPLPVIQSVLMVISILDLAIRMQATFFDVVRPLVKRDDGMRKVNVPSSGYGSIEDAILHHLDIAVFLGLFVGSAHQDITLAALSLLEKLSAAPKLVSTTGPANMFGPKIGKNRLLGIIESSPESRRILFNFIQQWDADVDGESPEMRYPLKFAILKFLDSSLSAQPNEFTLAHMILGFGCDEQGGISLSVEDGGIGSGIALLHSILAVVDDAVVSDDQGMSFDGALCQLKNDCFLVFKRLWRIPSTSGEILYVLRANKLLFTQFMGEQILKTTSKWDGIPFGCLEFFSRGKAAGLCNYIGRRSSLFNYIALEIRQLAVQGASTMVSKYLSTLLGVTSLDGVPMTNIHILDLLDFLELEAPDALPAPTINCFHDLNLTAFQQEDQFGNPSFHLPNIEQILLLRKQELLTSGTIASQDEDAVTTELTEILNYLFAENQLRLFRGARLDCLGSWATLVVVMLEDCEFEHAAKTSFLLQALQAVMPKVESYSSGDIESAQVLSSLTHSLIIHLTFDTTTFGKGQASDLANDRVYQLFRISLRCIQSPMATARLREDFYNIAYRYLKGTSDLSQQGNSVGHHSIQTIKASGDRLLEVLCNDAYSGEGQCKIVALLLLEALVALSAEEGSDYVVDALIRQNFLVVLVDSTKQIRSDLVNTSNNDIPYIMRSFKATTGFLVRIAQTRIGAGHIINAGLFKAFRDSQLFSVDPDLGVGINGPKALEKYYELLTDAMRVVVSCIISRGPQNRQALQAGRQFLMENRSVVLAVFKRHANIGGVRLDNIGDLEELVKMLVLMITLTEFVEFEESQPAHV